MQSLCPIHHLVITVSDLNATRRFYEPVLGFLGWSIRGSSSDYIEFVPPNDPQGKNFLLVFGLVRDAPHPTSSFNRNNVGLDHFAFQVSSLEELKALEGKLREAGIAMEDGGVTSDDFGGTAIFCVDPDGMKFEVHQHR